MGDILHIICVQGIPEGNRHTSHVPWTKIMKKLYLNTSFPVNPPKCFFF